jgi:hypothetical protein
MLDGFKATVDELPKFLDPKLVSMQDKIQAATDKIFENEKKRSEALNKGPAAAKPETPAPGTPEGKDKYHGTAAVEMGSKEAISAIARFRNGDSAKDKDAATTAKATTETAKGIDKLAGILTGAGAKAAAGPALALASI